MMTGLKSFLPTLGDILRYQPAALYERQRELVRLGLLTAGKGRGPGSGVKLSEDAVAVMLIALLVTDSLSETDERIKIFCDLRASRPCRLTGANTFREAVAAILSSTKIAERVTLLNVDRSERLAALHAKQPFVNTNFGETILRTSRLGTVAFPKHAAIIKTSSQIAGSSLTQIARELAEVASGVRGSA
jgi:hypothetical protein